MKKSIIALAVAGSVVMAGCAIDTPEVVDRTVPTTTPEAVEEAPSTTHTTVRTSPKAKPDSDTGDSYLYDPALDEGMDASADTGPTLEPGDDSVLGDAESTDEGLLDEASIEPTDAAEASTDDATADAAAADDTSTDDSTTTTTTTTPSGTSTTTTTTKTSGSTTTTTVVSRDSG